MGTRFFSTSGIIAQKRFSCRKNYDETPHMFFLLVKVLCTCLEALLTCGLVAIDIRLAKLKFLEDYDSL